MNEHNRKNPAPTAVNGAVSHTPLFISRRNLDMPLRPHRRATFEGTNWISVGIALARTNRALWKVTD